MLARFLSLFCLLVLLAPTSFCTCMHAHEASEEHDSDVPLDPEHDEDCPAIQSVDLWVPSVSIERFEVGPTFDIIFAPHAVPPDSRVSLPSPQVDYPTSPPLFVSHCALLI